MKKRILLFALCCWLLTGIAVQAAEPSAAAPLDWEISVRPKPTEQEIEKARWYPVFANDIAIYEFDPKSLRSDEADKNVVRVLTKTTFTDPKVSDNLNEKYKEKLTADDKVAYIEIEMAFQIRQKMYAVIGAKVFSEQGRLLEERQPAEKFAPVPVKTLADSMYDIAKNYLRNN
ncbi:hypothetical protein [Sporomusa aerivorans]|uniref:hypothetical protein n=1 Tax=Sporomusa aerivorans TaxID=204936 RepID=UPI00352B7BFA